MEGSAFHIQKVHFSTPIYEVPGVFAIRQALMVNKTLRLVTLFVDNLLHQVHNRSTLGANAFEAFSAMVRVNTSFVLKFPPFETASLELEQLEKESNHTT
jgi:hypothetical protein